MKFRALLILFFSLGITGIIVLPSVIHAWTEPTAAPPSNNVPAPINVSADAQSKAGAVSFNGTGVDSAIGVSTTGSAAGLKSFSTSGTTNCLLTPASNAGMTCEATAATTATGVSVSGKFTKGANVYGETTAITTSNLGGTDLATLSSNGYGISAQSSTTAAVHGKANAAAAYAAVFEGGKGVKITGTLEVAGQVKITGGGPANGKILTSDAAGLATWELPYNPYTIIAGAPGAELVAAVSTTPTAFPTPLKTFTKNSAKTKIEVIFQSYISVDDLVGAPMVIFELRIDNTSSSVTKATTAYWKDNAGTYSSQNNQQTTIIGEFTGLTAGSHEVELYVYTPSGTATNAYEAPSGYLDIRSVFVKEY